MKQVCLSVLVVVVLALGACKTKSELRPSAQGEARAAAESTQSVLQMTLTTDPPEVKDDKQFNVRINVADQSGRPVPDAKVHGELIMKTMDMGKNEFDFTSKGDGTYEVSAKPNMAGPWEIKVTAKRGADVGVRAFDLTVKE